MSLPLFVDPPQAPEKQKAAPLKSSNIVSREHPHIELKPGDEVFPPGDARAMSPRASNGTIGRMVRETQEEAEKRREQLSQLDGELDRSRDLQREYMVTVEGLEVLKRDIEQEQQRRSKTSGE